MDISKDHIIQTLDALAQDSRLDIFRLLIACSPDGMCVGDIGTALSLPHATLSFHLEKLKQAGLIVGEKQGRSVLYRADTAVLQTTLNYLTENCCGGMTCDVKKDFQC